ncbi:MAG: DUF2793 domain-containing protein [Pseudomonadota bacterium]
MGDTANFGIALLDAAQAQKHVTVNEALLRVDALAARRVESFGATMPPTGVEGQAHVVGTSATGDWLGHDGEIAIWLNDGWDFVAARIGWRVLDGATGEEAVFDGTAWVPGGIAVSPTGAQTVMRVAEIEHTLAAGATSTTAAVIPDKAVVIGVTARVTGAIGGASTWSMGVAGSTDRYGTGYGTGAGSYAHGVTGQPLAYYGDTALVLTAEGGNFSGGTVRLAVHYMALTPPAG